MMAAEKMFVFGWVKFSLYFKVGNLYVSKSPAMQRAFHFKGSTEVEV